MTAKIIHAEKKTIPQFNAATNQDEPTLVVETTVEFYQDDGTLYHTQTYAQRPEEIDPANPRAYFDAQAIAMQADLDGKEAHKDTAQQSVLADEIVDKLTPESNGEPEVD